MTIDKLNPWQVVRWSIKFDCSYFEVRQDIVQHAGGLPRPYNSIRMKYVGVAVLPIDSRGNVILVGQHRHVLGRYTWEVPGGGASAILDPLAVAKIELEEETGCCARQWLKIVDGAVSPGMTNEVIPGFVAWDLEEGLPRPDPEETLSLRRVSFKEAVRMALGDEIGHIAGVALILGVYARLTLGDIPPSLKILLDGIN